MPLEATVAASSPAEAEDVFQGTTPTLDEFNRYRKDGELPARLKPAEPAESAPADAQEETEESEPEEAKPASESEPEEVQEPKGAEKRIKQLLAKIKELERKPAEKTDAPKDSSTPQPAQNYADYRKAFKPSQWIEGYAKANPEASYEDATAAMADHLADARDHFRSIEQKIQAQKQALDAKLSEARSRYEDFDDIQSSFTAKLIGPKGESLVPQNVFDIINDSDVLADLLYTIGSDEAEASKFIEMAKTNPNKAIRYVARVESLIAEEQAKPRDDKGKFAAPETKKTSAPKPPSPVSGSSSRAFDVSDDSLSAEEWMRQRNKQLGKV